MPFVDNFICFCGNGMVESMLEPHLKEAGATQSQVGLTFLILGGVYMATTPIAGYVTLNCLNTRVQNAASFFFQLGVRQDKISNCCVMYWKRVHGNSFCVSWPSDFHQFATFSTFNSGN